MGNRREFVQGTLGLALVAGLGHMPDAMATGDGRQTVPLYKVIFDSRFADGRRYADEARLLGVATHAITGDITDLWFTDLDARWRDRKVAVAGLTTQSALFCLERLSWDHQMRVIFRAEHELSAAGYIEHTVSCSRDSLDPLRVMAIDAGGWAPRIAHLQRSIPETRAPEVVHTFTTPAGSPRVGDAELLVSWLIAPAFRR